MTYTYHLIYSCYNNSMQLLLNEKRVSQNSSLCRFMGEPFGKWCRQMLGLLARELRKFWKSTKIRLKVSEL